MDNQPNDKTLQRLLGPAESELLCDECFEKLDEYVDLELRGLPADDETSAWMRATSPSGQAEYEGRVSWNSFVSVMASVGQASTQRSQWMQRR